MLRVANSRVTILFTPSNYHLQIGNCFVYIWVSGKINPFPILPTPYQYPTEQGSYHGSGRMWFFLAAGKRHSLTGKGYRFLPQGQLWRNTSHPVPRIYQILPAGLYMRW